MKIKRPLPLLVIGLVLVVAGLAAFRAANYQSPPKPGYVVLKGYNHPEGPTCLAATPQCGYCPGMVVDKTCWIAEDYKDPFQP